MRKMKAIDFFFFIYVSHTSSENRATPIDRSILENSVRNVFPATILSEINKTKCVPVRIENYMINAIKQIFYRRKRLLKEL